MGLKQNFIKYHSLGNDLILFDWFHEKERLNELNTSLWHAYIKKICDRHFGVGADGVLILTGSSEEKIPEMLIYNSDGSSAQNCLNGLRCVAHYLFTEHHFPAEFKIKVGSRINECRVQTDEKNECLITSYVGSGNTICHHELATSEGIFSGYEVHMGNPHFIIFEPSSLEWLQKKGNLLESHPEFPGHINVEFICESKTKIQGKKTYDVLIYERGCGITLACSSGAAAITHLLFQKKVISINEKIVISMPGGILNAWCDAKGEIVLEATARLVFTGTFSI